MQFVIDVESQRSDSLSRVRGTKSLREASDFRSLSLSLSLRRHRWKRSRAGNREDLRANERSRVGARVRAHTAGVDLMDFRWGPRAYTRAHISTSFVASASGLPGSRIARRLRTSSRRSRKALYRGAARRGGTGASSLRTHSAPAFELRGTLCTLVTRAERFRKNSPPVLRLPLPERGTSSRAANKSNTPPCALSPIDGRASARSSFDFDTTIPRVYTRTEDRSTVLLFRSVGLAFLRIGRLRAEQ